MNNIEKIEHESELYLCVKKIDHVNSVPYEDWCDYYDKLFVEGYVQANEFLYIKLAELLVKTPVVYGRIPGDLGKEFINIRKQNVEQKTIDLIFAIKIASNFKLKYPTARKGAVIFSALETIKKTRDGQTNINLGLAEPILPPVLEDYDLERLIYKDDNYNIKDYLYNNDKPELRTSFGKGITFIAYGKEFATAEDARRYEQLHCGYEKGGSKK